MEAKNDNQPSVNWNWLWGLILIGLGGAALLGQFVPDFGGLMVAAFFVGGGAIFFTIYMRDHEHWWALIPGYAMLVIGALIAMGTAGFPGSFIGMFVMCAIAVPFLYVYVRNKEHWWALIPAYAMLVIGAIIAMVTVDFPGNLVGMFALLAIAFPFLYVYVRNRENWWALIPAYAMIAVTGVIALAGAGLPGMVIASYVMFSIAFPFFYVYLRHRENWWALIPAGITGMVGTGLLLGSNLRYVGPAAVILLGLYLLSRQVIHDKSETAPTSGPDADRPPSV